MDAQSVESSDASAPLTVTTWLGQPSVITVEGDTDLDGLGSLRQAVRDALDRCPHVVFDLAAVTFADSSFLNLLLETRLAAAEQGGSVRLRTASVHVRRLLDITGAARLFPVSPGDPPDPAAPGEPAPGERGEPV